MRYVLGLVFAVFFSSAVAAQDGDIRLVIRQQIDAFEQDDFTSAFEFASPGIQSLFGTPERFGQMVRSGYPMVWRPDEVRFLELREISGHFWQKIMVRDQNGSLHVLDYKMESGPSGWKIDGVQLLKAPSGSA